jgi:CelD/BcsL family acetyltransferase involved in cellulose biosynthesis
MAQSTPALLEVPSEADAFRLDGGHAAADHNHAVRYDIHLSVHEDLVAIEREWREFEQRADATVFQTYEWLVTYQRHIGARRGVRPAVVIARDSRGEIMLMLPLAVERTMLAARLTWLGSELCNYNAPLLAPDFSLHVSLARFRQLWDEVRALLVSHSRLGFDLVDLEQIPETVGSQHNPMLHLGVTPHRDCAYLVSLADSWEQLYAKRSSTTRRHDRAKRNKLAEHGEVRFVNATDAAQIAGTLDTLMTQKARWFAEMGINNIFVRPGVREFFVGIASDPNTRAITNVSRLEVGDATVAANFGLMFGNCYYHVLASYDRASELARFGPGTLHLHELMRCAIDRGFHKFDFSLGNERFKDEWCDRELKLYDHLAVLTVRGAVAALPIIAARQIKAWIKASPTLWNVFRKARAATGRFKALR